MAEWRRPTSSNTFDVIGGITISQTEVDFIDQRNAALLAIGFVTLTRGATTGTRTLYNGNVIGEPDQNYYFDSSDLGWYEVATGGTPLIQFSIPT